MSNTPTIIGFGSTARVGKDVAARIIDNRNGLDNRVRRVAFADFVKEDLNNFCIKHYSISAYTEKAEEKQIIRPLLIGHGNAMRALNPDYWIDRAFEHIDFDSPELDYIIFTDVRFPNEVARIKSVAPRSRSFYVQVYADDSPPVIESEIEQYDKMVALADYFLYNPFKAPKLAGNADLQLDAYTENIRTMLGHFRVLEQSYDNFLDSRSSCKVRYAKFFNNTEKSE
jgi:hypothetical protein